jgi:predicted peptidase
MFPVPQDPGIHPHTTITGLQNIFISIPKDYQPGQPVPLVLALHWGGPVVPQTPKIYLEEIALPGLGGLDAIIVAPTRQREHWATPEAENDLRILWQYLLRQYLIDQNKTLITGHSLGGIGAWNLAAKEPDLFRAVLPVSAQPPAIILSIDWQTPIYTINSREDEIFPMRYTEETMQSLQAEGKQAILVLLDEITHFETERFIPAMIEAVPWIRQVWQN